MFIASLKQKSVPRTGNGFLKLFFAATAHLCASCDNHEDRPRDTDKAPGQNTETAQQEIQTEQDDEPRQNPMMGATARLSHFRIFHKFKYKSFDLFD